MDIIGLVGLVLALALMVFGVVFTESSFVFSNLINFIDYPSVAITIGGTFAVLMVSYSIESFIKIPTHLKIFDRIIGNHEQNFCFTQNHFP